MDQATQVAKFSRAAWTDARGGLARALEYRDVEEAVADEVMRGVCECWRIDHGDGGAPSYMVTRVEGPELVIVAYEGRLVREAMHHIVAHVKARGFVSLRFHTTMPWLVEMFADFDPVPVEHVLRVYIDGRKVQKLYRKHNFAVTNDYEHANRQYLDRRS